MQDDIQTIAENKLDTLLEQDEQAKNTEGGENTLPQDDTNKENGEGEDNQDEAQGKTDDGKSEVKGDGEGKKETDNEEESGEPDEDKQKKSETQELSDEQLLAELEKRGLKVAKEDDKKTNEPRQPAKWEARPDEVPENVWSQMEPANKFIYNNLPYITAVGKDGDTIRVKTPDQLPDDFEFASKKAESQFFSEVTAQSNRADKMADDIKRYQTQQQQQAATQAESQQVVVDVERLQKEGVVPKITAQPNTAEFNDDEGVKVANEILKLRDEINSDGKEQISVYRAGLIYKGMHPELYQTKKVEAKGDDERKRAASKVNGSAGGDNKSNKSAPRRKFPLGMSARDIADFYEKDLD